MDASDKSYEDFLVLLWEIPDVLGKFLISQSQFEGCIAELAVSISERTPCGSRLLEFLKIILAERVPEYSYCDDVKYVEVLDRNFVGIRLLQLSEVMLETDISKSVSLIIKGITIEILKVALKVECVKMKIP